MSIETNDVCCVELGGTVMMYGSVLVSVEDKGDSISVRSLSAPDGYAGSAEESTTDRNHFEKLLNALSKLQFEVEDDYDEDENGSKEYRVVESDEGNGAVEWYLSISYRDETFVNYVGYDYNSESFRIICDTLKTHVGAFENVQAFFDGV